MDSDVSTVAEERASEQRIEHQIDGILRRVLDDPGIAGWWDRPRHALTGRTPRQTVEDGDGERVIELALHLARTA
jgi:hypothetical protein